MVVRRQVLDEIPGSITVLPVLRDPDDRPVDVSGAVQVRLRVVHRHRGGPVLQLGMLVLDERDAPFAVQHHRKLARLEGVRCRELVTGAGLPLDELVVAVEVDQALLPFQQSGPGRIRAQARLAVAREVLPADERPVRRHARPTVVEGRVRVVADDLERPVGVLLRQLLRIRRQLRERLRRPGQARLLEERLVVVEAVGVREERQRAARSLVLGVVPRRRREDVGVDLVPLEQRAEIDPATRGAVDPDVLGGERAHHIGSGTRAERGNDLVVVDAAHDLDLDAGVLLVVLGDQRLELLQLRAGAPADPDRQLRRGCAVGCRR